MSKVSKKIQPGDIRVAIELKEFGCKWSFVAAQLGKRESTIRNAVYEHKRKGGQNAIHD